MPRLYYALAFPITHRYDLHSDVIVLSYISEPHVLVFRSKEARDLAIHKSTCEYVATISLTGRILERISGRAKNIIPVSATYVKRLFGVSKLRELRVIRTQGLYNNVYEHPRLPGVWGCYGEVVSVSGIGTPLVTIGDLLDGKYENRNIPLTVGLPRFLEEREYLTDILPLGKRSVLVGFRECGEGEGERLAEQIVLSRRRKVALERLSGLKWMSELQARLTDKWAMEREMWVVEGQGGVVCPHKGQPSEWKLLFLSREDAENFLNTAKRLVRNAKGTLQMLRGLHKSVWRMRVITPTWARKMHGLVGMLFENTETLMEEYGLTRWEVTHGVCNTIMDRPYIFAPVERYPMLLDIDWEKMPRSVERVGYIIEVQPLELGEHKAKHTPLPGTVAELSEMVDRGLAQIKAVPLGEVKDFPVWVPAPSGRVRMALSPQDAVRILHLCKPSRQWFGHVPAIDNGVITKAIGVGCKIDVELAKVVATILRNEYVMVTS